MHDLLAGYPVILEIPVAWGEMDAFQHVNNTVYLRYAESARIAYLDAAGLGAAMTPTGVGPILASISCRFKFPLTFPDTALVGTRVGEIGADRFHMSFRIVSVRHGRVAAEGDSVIVTYDYSAGGKVPLPASVREAIERLEAAAHAQPEPAA